MQYQDHLVRENLTILKDCDGEHPNFEAIL